jgi:DnaK suppressor protein
VARATDGAAAKRPANVLGFIRSRDRQRKLIAKIDAALMRLDDGTYGYCEETGEPLSLKRLDARPIAILSVEAQERHEQRERIYRND